MTHVRHCPIRLRGKGKKEYSAIIGLACGLILVKSLHKA